MVESALSITAPSRLHFGMLSFGWPGRRQYGGVGAMLDKPLRLTMAPADSFIVRGTHSDRAKAFARRWAAEHLGGDDPACEIEVESAARAHIGLGSGTQLALAIAAGLFTFYGKDLPDAESLTTSVGRGGRSAVGTYGFLRGGLITEQGRKASEQLAPLHQRVEIPAQWRFVLLQPHNRRGVHGEDESRAFLQLPPVPTATSEALWKELDEQMLPALQRGEFSLFSESVYRYGILAGECFARVQGGPFSSPKAAQIVAEVRALGFPGVGQSSWGPTLFALADSDERADWLVSRLTTIHDSIDCEICRPNNTGWQCEVAAA
jgi:beta-RFAP synthase